MALRFGKQGIAGGLVLGDQGSFSSGADVFGSGVLVAQDATISGDGQRGSQDIGPPPELGAQPGAIVGSGKVVHTGSGAMVAQSATISGTGGAPTFPVIAFGAFGA